MNMKKEQIKEVVKMWLDNEAKNAYVDYWKDRLDDVTLDGSFDLEQLVEDLDNLLSPTQSE